MCEVLSPAGLVLVLLAVRVGAESAVLRFRGQTRFRVEESSRSVVRLQVERVGVPVNVTALVLLEGEDTGDFEATTAAAFLQSTETSKTIFIAIRDDDLPEADETFVFTLRLQSSSNGVTLGTPNTATITILSNDNAFGIISFNSSALITVDEPKGKNQYLPLSLIRERGTYGTVTVKFEVFGGPNPAIEDLSPDRGNITIPPGRAVVVYSLLIQDDQLPEDDEIFTVQLTGVAGGALLNPNRSSVQIRIRRNDAPVRFSGPSLAVAENAGVLALNVSRGRTESGILVGSDDAEVSVNYTIVTGDGPAGATPSEDFADLQTSRTVVFPPGVHEMQLHFNISDDDVPEIAESFQVVLLEETLRGDAVLVSPSVMQVTIEPNDKPYGVLSISSPSPPKPIIINEDQTLRFEGIFVVRNGGTHGDVSVNWTIMRNSSDPSPVSDDLVPSSGVLRMTAGQMRAALPLNITQDALPEEAEAFLLRLLPDSVQGGAEVDEPMGMVFYIQDSDDVYGRFAFHPEERQSIQSQPEGRFLSLSFLRDGGTLGEVRLDLTALYIPAGPLDLTRARDGILNGSSTNTLRFSSGQSRTQLILPIRNDAFLQNGAHFLIRLDSVQLVSIIPLVLSMSPRFGGAVNLSLTVTPDIANGEIGFTSNRTVVALEPEDGNSTTITLPLKRDGTDGQAQVFWSLRPFGENKVDVTSDDLSPFSGSVTFLSGQSEAEINIAVLADDVPEINESLALTLDRTNVDNQILKQGFTSREIVILENDDPGGVFEFSPVSKGPWIINEGETVELRVVRAQGQLLKQLVRYTVMPAGNAQFYGATGILEFQPGEREVVVALVARPDGVPELEETYSVILSSYSTPASRLGNRRQVNITVRQSDDPFGVIEFAHPAMDFAINESKGVTTHSASYPILRSRGRFGNVSVSWVLEPAHSGDVTPVQGEVLFSEGEFLKNLTLFSQPDEIPEELETFTISLLNATGGARLGNVLNASLQITENDDPLYFAEPAVVRVQEGGVANFTVLRAGLANFVATVMYRFDYGSASPEDIAPLGNSSLLVFEVGQWMKNISVAVDDDDIPETDEPLYIVLFNATGDAVVYGQGTATVVIEANDDANGIFSLEPTEKAVLEGKSNNFYVRRDRGHFGNVTVFWQLFANDTPLEPSQEFFNTSGSIEFTTGMETKPIVLEAISDKLPEFIEFYELRLVNISGGHPGEGGRLATRNLNTSVLIPFNDDPFGVFAIDRDSLVREVAEDVLSEDDASDITSFTILRQQGTFGVVRVAWEILSGAFPSGLPPMLDLILMATFPRGVVPRPHSRRYHSGTDALSFSGRPGSYGTVSVDDQPGDGPSTLANFTISAWLMPKPNTEGFVFSKGNGNGSLQYGVKVLINESHVTTMLYYTAAGSNNAQAARSTAAKFVEENVWVHVVVAVEDGIIEFYLDGNPVPGGVKSLKGEAIVNEAAPILIGSDPDGRQLFTGLLQDVRLYPGSRLDHAQIHELHVRPAKADLRNVSGYLEYRQDERSKSFVVEVRDDRQEEGEEEFYLQLVAVHGGARLPMPRPTAILRVMKSDNANGLFGFTGACIPDIAEEGSTISCVVERTRGALDYVSVNYAVVQTDPTGVASNMSDFANATGSILFPPGHRSEVLNLLALDDDIPELDENFQIVLVSAISADGKPGSTPTSGASIDPNNAVTTVTIKASDHPYGLLQFQTSPLIAEVIRPAVKEARVTVREEAGVARLLVTRAQGLLGRVMVGYRTTPFTASSPEDYEDADGLLDFLPGERFKYINVTIVDNPVPELDKIFRVELYNPSGGVEPFFERELSGSGEGDSESFLPSFHHHASLGLAYRITVTIGASDEAHGVFRFGGDSLAVNGTEPDEGRSSVTLQVIRTFGDLSNVTLYWEADPDSEGELEYRSGNLTFAVGQRVGNIVLQVSQDDIPELDKSFKIILTNVSNGRLGNQTVAVITVLANDDPYGLFLFPDSSRPIRVPESDSLVTLTIQRRGGLMGIVRVTFGTLRDSDAPPYGTPGVGIASEGRDFVPVRQTVTFSANQSEANVTLRVLDDQEPERAESVFVRLLSISLAQGEQSRPVALSPRLGVGNKSVAQVIIAASDDAFGVLQLSSPAVSVAEHYTGPIINVTRTGGIFADVSVKFRAVPMTARVGEDYSVASSDVVLLEGESSKPVPILIINDRLPELEETFRIELLNQTTGGALLGPITQAVITILPSDDPYGSFVFQAEHVTVEEPGINAFEVSLPIVRNAGTIGRVSIQWRATVNGRPATGDLRPLSGEVTFAAGETMKTLKVEVLADDVPEIEEVIKVELTGATNGGSIGSDNVVNIIVPANDNPHGSVYFERAVYRVQEPLEGVYTTNITVRRSGGHFGQLEILYSTVEIDVVSIAQQAGQDFLIFYDPPMTGALPAPQRQPLNITSSADPRNDCAASCLRQPLCQAFSYTAVPMPTCFWATAGPSQLASAPGTLAYRKNSTAAVSLFSSQAVAGSDYTTVTAQAVIVPDGAAVANLTVPILSDSLPEVDESFSVRILKVGLVNASAAEKNKPTVGQPDVALVTIGMNGDAFGVFSLYSVSPNATDGGLYLEVREEPQTRVLLVVERMGGSLGQVTVEWKYVGGNATPNADFNGTGETLVFAEGDVKKTIEFFIADDTEPEANETLRIGLVRTEGGSRILPSSDTVTVLILANDNAAGVLGFGASSRSAIAREGESVALLVERTAPAVGNVTVEWGVQGPRPTLTFVDTSGMLFFTEGMLNDTVVLQLLDDSTPEEREEYRITLSNVKTEGVTVTGMARLDPQGVEAVVTVEASDEPFGMLSIPPSSLRLTTAERDITIRIYINREFGASGAVNISYETVRGSLEDLALTQTALAEPGQDFLHVSGSVVLQDGQTSVSVPITIMDDDIPELREVFLVNVTSAVVVTTLSTAPTLGSSNPVDVYYTLKDTQGLVAQISIEANDGVQGIIGWQSVNFEVNETVGVVTLVAYRNAGTYGNVSLFFYAQNLEAQLGFDYNVTPAMLHFVDGERYKFVEVEVLDDAQPEGDERFQLILTNPSAGLELGENITATVTILTNDDGRGVISFNTSEHFLLMEPTSVSGLGQSMATLYVVRDPPQGTFGTVSVQFSVTDSNGSRHTSDLSPSDGFVVLEDGVRFKTLEIWAVLDEEPEMNETFTVTLFDPLGGARLGRPVQTFITVLQNQAPLGLFRITASRNRTDTLMVEENAGTVFLTVSRSNGLDSAVSVEWETQSDTAFGMKGEQAALVVYQALGGTETLGWCVVPGTDPPMALRLQQGRPGSASPGLATPYTWQGVLGPLQPVAVDSPSRCVGFAVNGSSYVAVTHGVSAVTRHANLSLYRLQPDLNLTLVQTLTVADPNIKHFSADAQQYLVASTQVFKWVEDSLSLHQTLDLQDVSAVSPISRGNSNKRHLVVCQTRATSGCLVYLWSGGSFQNPQPLDIEARVTQAESFDVGGESVLFLLTEGPSPTCEVFLWGAKQSAFQQTQSIPFPGLSSIHPFMPPSGILHVTLAGQRGSALFAWRSDQRLFSEVLRSAPAGHFLFLPVPSFNDTKSLMATSGPQGPQGTIVYELTSMFNQSDFIPSSGELRFMEGVKELEIAVNIVDDDLPEEEERFRVVLKNPKGGAEIGFGGQVTVIIPANDDTYGVIGFTQNSLLREVEELREDNIISLSVERKRGMFGRLTVHWTAHGNTEDIFPTSGVVSFSPGQAIASISLSVLSDGVPELDETVAVVLTKVTTVGIADLVRGAVIDPFRSRANLTIRANGSPYGVIGWHLDSQYYITPEPQRSPSNITLSIIRDQGSSGDIIVYYTTLPALAQPPVNQATAGQDYIAKESTVVMMEDATVALVTITILPDEVPELAESFLVNLTRVELSGTVTGAGQPSLRRPGLEVAEVTIQESDDPRGVLQLNVSQDTVIAYEVPPPGNLLRLPVVRLAGSVGRVAVYWEAQPITASFDDFSPAQGNLTFSDEQSLGVIEITITDDTLVESVETFLVRLTHVIGGARLGTEISVTISIPPNDSPLGRFGFESLTVTVTEPQFEGDPAAVATLVVVRREGDGGTVHLIWLLQAEGADDLEPHNGTLVFEGAVARKSLEVYAVADSVLEGEERFTIQLLSARNEPVIDPVRDVATVVIEANRGALGSTGIAESSRNILIGEPEGSYNGTALISLVRGPGIFGEIQIYWNITPAMDTEFERTAGIVTMRDQQSAATILLRALDDDVPELRRDYQLTLTSMTPGSEVSPNRKVATVTMVASDHPYGVFSFSQSSLRVSEEDKMVNVTVVRGSGLFGSVWVSYRTEAGTALGGEDFQRASGRLLFGAGVSSLPLALELLDDALPEGPETFRINITHVELLNDSVDSTLREGGLQLDQPPATGSLSSITLVILPSDNAQGILEFHPDYVNITVDEDVGTVSIPVVRRVGSYGSVSADVISRGLTAKPGDDYFLSNASVHFLDRQNLSYINVSIVDDLDREYSETFELRLSAPTGGATLGAHLVARVTIAKSDSPNGVVRFVNDTSIVIANPDSTLLMTLVLERAGGFVGNATITWNILGPNSKEVLPSVNADFGEPVSGSFRLGDGEEGRHVVELQILPHREVEVAETFVVGLSVLEGDVDIDPKAGSVTITVEKFGDPNGIVQFAEQDLAERVYSEPSDSDGPLAITLLVMRREGVMGNITVFWEIQSESDATGDFSAWRGSVAMTAGQRVAELQLSLLPDGVPELEELYAVRLIAADGGAELDADRAEVRLRVRANDEPHGAFLLRAERQALEVAADDGARSLILNVSRMAGGFGDVDVRYRVRYGLAGDAAMGSVLVRDGERSASVAVAISSQLFLEVGSNFTVELTNVSLIGPLLSSPPRILLESKSAVVSVPEAAANAEVGFDSLALQVASIESGQCEALLSRRGLYGNVTVEWAAGFPPGQAPPGYRPGDATPSFGAVVLAHGQASASVPFAAVLDPSEPTAHAIHLTSARSRWPGGARIRPGFSVAEVEPLGVYLFSADSQQLVVQEDEQTVTLYIQRFYGFRSNVSQLSYTTWPGSARPGEDFVAVSDGQVLFEPRQTSAPIQVSVLDDTLTEPDENFYVNLTSVKDLGIAPPSTSARPRIAPEGSVASVTILANDAASGFLSVGPSLVRVTEDRQEGAPDQRVALRVCRTAGLSGTVRVRVHSYTGGLQIPGTTEQFPFLREENGTWASEGEDFSLEVQTVTLQEGQSEAEVLLQVLDDEEPEGEEVLYVYLGEVQGGAQVVGAPDQHGFTGYAKIIILGSDVQNGFVGFSVLSQTGQTLDEDSDNRTAVLFLLRQENRAFEDVEVYWRVTFSTTGQSLASNGVNLTTELLQTAGRSLCRRGEVICEVSLEVRADKEPEFPVWFLVEIYQVGSGAAINQSARFANVTMLESDDPRGLVYFAVGSRLPSATLKTTRLTLQVYRLASVSTAMTVRYRTVELQKAQSVGPTLIWPAVAGKDFVAAEGVLTFDPGQRSTGLDVVLTPDTGSSNPAPKRFRVALTEASGGVRVHPRFGLAEVTLVTDAPAQAVWAALDQLQQPLDETIINGVLENLLNKASGDVSREQLTAVLEALNKVLTEAEQTPLMDSSRGLTYDLLCALANPNRADTRGLSQLAEVTERFAFSLLTDAGCGAEGQRGRTILDSCPHFSISAFRWYPSQINGHAFAGSNGDSFSLPERLLEVPVGALDPGVCRNVHFTQYSTEHWFLTQSHGSALNDKVFSVSVQGRGSRPLSDGGEVLYRIHTPNRRVKPRQAVCLLWNQAAESWLSDEQFCRVLEDGQGYVECACRHLSVYTASAETDTAAAYNRAFYAAGFICISGFALAVVSHVVCARFPMFAAKLLTHMMVACLGTQICFLVSAFRGRMLSEDGCATLGLFSHYFHLCQFTWMLTQAVNFWQTLVMNDEHTDRRYLLYFLLSWGLPALVIAVLVIVLLGGYGWSIHSVYGLVQGDICFIPNVYAALCTAVLVPLICLVGVVVVFIHAYQVTQQWKAYDDLYRGRTNSSEVPMVLYLFALVSVVWLWAGLHMAYRFLWLLILLVIFNILLGLYVFAVYFIMHNPLCWPAKASYTVEMNGHGSPDGVFQGVGAATVGGEISKSTQNLISAMEEVSADWERTSLRASSQPSSVFKPAPQNGSYSPEGGFINTTLAPDEDSQEFDDLIFALKTGSGLNISDTESTHGSHDGGGVANSQIVELRRIPIADTHL